MQYYNSSKAPLTQDALIGGKATNLYRLIASGMPVPPFVVIPQNVLNALVPEAVQTADPSTIITYIQQIAINQTDIDTIIASLP